MEAAPAGPRVGVLEAERDLQQGVEGELQRQRVDHRERRPGAAPRREARVPRAREDAVPDDRDAREGPRTDLFANKSVSRVYVESRTHRDNLIYALAPTGVRYSLSIAT